jgi:hypothetical protein
MALAFKHPVQRLLNGTAELIYSASGVSLQMDAVTLTNTSGSEVTVSLWTTQGGAPSDPTLLLINYSVPALTTKAPFEAKSNVVEDGMQLYAKASVAGVVALSVSGREQTI